MDKCTGENELEKGKVLAIFVSGKCFACAELKNELLNITVDDEGDIPNKIVIIENTEACSEVLNKYNISEYPTVVRLRNGIEEGRTTGIDYDSIRALIEGKTISKEGGK